MNPPHRRRATTPMWGIWMPIKIILLWLMRQRYACGGLAFGLLATLRSSAQAFNQQQEGIKGAWHHPEAAAQEERRHLQSACSVEKALTITSSALPLTDGCYFPETLVTGLDVYLATSYTAAVTFINITERSGDEYWVLAQNPDGFLSSPEGDVVCLSNERYDESDHPSEVTWECDADGDGLADNFTTAEFSTSCGCSSTPSPTAAPDRPLPVNGTCGEPRDEILVVSTLYPGLAGCYFDTMSTHLELPTYTMTGTNASDQVTVFAQEQEDDSSQVNWILAYQPTDDPDEFVLYCYSEEEAKGVHPSEVETWFCDQDVDDTTKLVEVSWMEFDIVCGCTLSNSSFAPSLAPDASSTPEPTVIGINIPTPSPVSAPYSFKCEGINDEFQVISTEVNAINGECFIAAPRNSPEDTIIYTTDGERGVGQFAVIPVPVEDTNPLQIIWSIGYFASEEDGSDDNEIYYLSMEEASAVHPTEASWVFVISESREEWSFQSTGLVVECGCSEVTDTEGGSSITSSSALSIVLPALTSGIMVLILGLAF